MYVYGSRGGIQVQTEGFRVPHYCKPAAHGTAQVIHTRQVERLEAHPLVTPQDDRRKLQTAIQARAPSRSPDRPV
eukprot:7409284-Heterocapsa_arctica.AAC.1